MKRVNKKRVKFRDDSPKEKLITDEEIEQFNRAIRDNLNALLKDLKEEKVNKTKRKTFKYDLGEDTDSENEFDPYTKNKRTYQFMIPLGTKEKKSKPG